MRNIEKHLDELYNYVEQAHQINTAVSSVNVGWHIEHSSLVVIKIVETVSKSDPNNYKWKFNLKRSYETDDKQVSKATCFELQFRSLNLTLLRIA